VKRTRRELEDVLRADAQVSTPAPDPAFVAQLERRLVALDLDAPPVLRRRITRMTGAAAVATTLTFVGAAAAAGIVITVGPEHRPSTEAPVTTQSVDGKPSVVPVSTVVNTTTTAESVTTLESATTVISTTNVEPESSVLLVPTVLPESTVLPVPTVLLESTVPSVMPASSAVPATVLVPVAPVEPATSLPADTPSTPPASTPQASTPPTTTTEVHAPATLTLSCAPAAGGISCTWSAGPSGTVEYLLLRSTPAGGPGRVLFPPPGVTAFVDTTVSAGTAYVYLVHARDAAGVSLAHSSAAQVDCCG
jgi:hypothetical protein